MKNKHNFTYNILTTIIISAICFFLYHKSGVMEDAGMAAIILNWIPLIIGIGTLVVYFITRAIKLEAGWVITLLGNLFNIIIVISAFMS